MEETAKSAQKAHNFLKTLLGQGFDTSGKDVFMANIRENKKNGKVVSYRFTVCLDRDAKGKQIRRYTTWFPPSNLTPAKMKKAAERAADAWEQKVRAEYEQQAEAENRQSYALPPEKRRDDFVSFVKEVWFDLYICNGDRKETTVSFYEDIMRHIVTYFKGITLQDISPIHIQLYLKHLRIAHEKRTGRSLSARYLRHHFGTLKNTEYYLDMKESIDDATWMAKYMGNPYIREGLLFPADELRYYNGVLPDGEPDRIAAVVDTAWGGGDSLSMPIAYVYGEEVYIADVVFNAGDKTVTVARRPF